MEFFRYRRRPVVVDTTEINGPPDRRDAFEEGVRIGRTQERARHRGHLLIKLAVVVIAIAGAAVLALAAREGSFSRGGAVVDQNIAVAADNAKVGAADAAAQAGQAVKDAGDTVAKKAADVVHK